MNLVDRVKNILMSPQSEWPTIAAEAATTQSIYVPYVLILQRSGPSPPRSSAAAWDSWSGS